LLSIVKKQLSRNNVCEGLKSGVVITLALTPKKFSVAKYTAHPQLLRMDTSTLMLFLDNFLAVSLTLLKDSSQHTTSTISSSGHLTQFTKLFAPENVAELLLHPEFCCIAYQNYLVLSAPPVPPVCYIALVQAYKDI
jgi:hypothetical protein